MYLFPADGGLAHLCHSIQDSALKGKRRVERTAATNRGLVASNVEELIREQLCHFLKEADNSVQRLA